MGKKRIIKKSGGGYDSGLKSRALSRVAKRQIEKGVLHIQSTYNNTLLTLAEASGAVLCASSSGALGFKGARKGTPYAAAKVGELIGEKAVQMGMRDADIIVKGVGAGRESSVRGFISRGISISSLRDATPVPFNGPRPPKPRRV
ncbi:MAG: 30S ribosomal protein S11 [bacterium]|nr:30S ribosomal protein S11 [bacterium]MDZ4284700.1 30S ribosomal protein S11 [Patescibacteria group bacterium]